MTAREAEAELLARCVAVARQENSVARDQREANVFRLAAMVIQSSFPRESALLMKASQTYFEQHPDELLQPEEVLNKSWILGLPRLRNSLSLQLQQSVQARV